MGVIQQYLKKNNAFSTVSEESYSHICNWMSWYSGSVKKFHTYWIYDGIESKKQERYKLSMAKKVCEDWANLLLNEKISIKAGSFDVRLKEILESNNFSTRANQLIEIAYAFGTGAIVEYFDNKGSIVIDCIRADMIYPLSWDNGRITECAFGSVKTIDKKEYVYLQIHRKGSEDKEDPSLYYIDNKYLDAQTGGEIELPSDISSTVNTMYSEPLFQIITPNIVNNLDLDSPMGISVFANGIDQVLGCDLIYDSYMNEFVLGRKRILVPYSRAKISMQKDSELNADPLFDPNDNIYFVMPGDRDADSKITEVDMSIRASDHELGINKALDLLSLKCGMGTGRYKFESGGIKTATEVISDKSDLYQNLQKNKIPVNAALVAMVKCLFFLDGNTSKLEVNIDFDDSIIEDGNTTIDKNIKLVQSGLRSKLSAIMEINKCSESEAKKELELIAEDNQITGQDIDWFGDDKDNDINSEDGNDTEKKVKNDDTDRNTKSS